MVELDEIFHLIRKCQGKKVGNHVISSIYQPKPMIFGDFVRYFEHFSTKSVRISFKLYVIWNLSRSSQKWYYCIQLNLWIRHLTEAHNTRDCQKLHFSTTILVKTIRFFMKTNDIFEISTKNWVDLCVFHKFSTAFIFWI
jgi:hypothetical protein